MADTRPAKESLDGIQGEVDQLPRGIYPYPWASLGLLNSCLGSKRVGWGGGYIHEWQGAKETTEFCQFWRFSTSAIRDCNGGMTAGFLYLVRHITPSFFIIIIYIRCQFCSLAFALWLHLVIACFSFFCFCIIYVLVFLPAVLFVGSPRWRPCRVFSSGWGSPPTLVTCLTTDNLRSFWSQITHILYTIQYRYYINPLGIVAKPVASLCFSFRVRTHCRTCIVAQTMSLPTTTGVWAYHL